MLAARQTSRLESSQAHALSRVEAADLLEIVKTMTGMVGGAHGGNGGGDPREGLDRLALALPEGVPAHLRG